VVLKCSWFLGTMESISEAGPELGPTSKDLTLDFFVSICNVFLGKAVLRCLFLSEVRSRTTQKLKH